MTGDEAALLELNRTRARLKRWFLLLVALDLLGLVAWLLCVHYLLRGG